MTTTAFEYDLRVFRAPYPPGSIGWGNRTNRPDYQASKWMNEKAADGWRLSTIDTASATCVTVCMERPIAPAGDVQEAEKP